MVTRPAKKPVRPKIKRHRAEKSAIDLVEEAFHLLRRSSLVTLSCYYIGSMPFILALLYFWTDMSRSAYAEERCAGAAFGLALLFVWMKSWQAVFAQRLKESLQHVPFSPYSWRRVWHLTMTQAIIQSWGMLLLPCSLLIGAPFPWLYAFYQNATSFGCDEHGSVKHVRNRAWQQAKLWPKQNCLLIWLLSPWLLVSGVLGILLAFFGQGSLEFRGELPGPLKQFIVKLPDFRFLDGEAGAGGLSQGCGLGGREGGRPVCSGDACLDCSRPRS